MTRWEIKGFGCLSVAATELEAWLHFMEVTGWLVQGFAFVYTVSAYRRMGIVAREINTEAHD